MRGLLRNLIAYKSSIVIERDMYFFLSRRGGSGDACVAPIHIKLIGHNPTPGRPQGSHPLIHPTPALTKTRTSQCPLRCLCKGGGRVVRSGDPCGRPGVGRFPSLSTLT